MSDHPHLTTAKQAEHAARAERLAKALRQNLRRRKEHGRQDQGRQDQGRQDQGRQDQQAAEQSRVSDEKPAAG